MLLQITLRAEIYITDFEQQVRYNENQDEVLILIKKGKTYDTTDEFIQARINVAEKIAFLLYK